MKMAAKNFKRSPQGKAFRKEMKELKHAIKDELEVTDIPEDWKHNADLLKIEVSDHGQEVINQEWEEVMNVGKAIKHSKPVKRVGRALEDWAETKEVQALKKLDQAFLQSKEGKELMEEWKEFGEALKKHVQETPNGIHIDDEGIEAIEEEAEDLDREYSALEHSHWAKKYDAAWKAALETQEAHVLGHEVDAFGHSKEWKALEKELKDLDAALQKHVEVSDVPEHWKHNTDLLKIEVDDTGAQAIEKELRDIEHTMDAIEHSQPVQRLGHSIEELAETPEAQHLK